LDDAVEGRAPVEPRLGLLVEAPGVRAFALNELAIEKTVPGHMVRLATSVNDEHLLTYAADGVVVATPTGSTAYNLSAGGPVISPGLDVLVLTPVAPHFTIDRSIVLGPDEVVSVTVLEDRPAVLVADGSLLAQLAPGATVTVRRDPVPVQVVVGARHGVGGRLRASLREGHR
ncbi:MAG TPA: NAD(+)/NADH kinase, partial [Acidimicrobiales bacterium]|nr:NAD(+)/NADH kinase [Acidimicrobiales bacterium]